MWKEKYAAIVQLKEAAETTDRLFFLLSYINGQDLEHWTKQGRLYAKGSEEEVLERVLRIVYELALGIAYVHSKGILHKDLKPANILMGRKMADPYNEDEK